MEFSGGYYWIGKTTDGESIAILASFYKRICAEMPDAALDSPDFWKTRMQERAEQGHQRIVLNLPASLFEQPASLFDFFMEFFWKWRAVYYGILALYVALIFLMIAGMVFGWK